jgi:hypothetical protein
MTAVTYNINQPEAASLLVSTFGATLPTAGQPLTDGISVEGSGRAAYLNIAFSSPASSTLTLTRTVGATTVSELLNGGASVAANTLYEATVMVGPDEIINLLYGVGSSTYTCKIAAVVQNG